MRIIDTKGQQCPLPIIAAKKALRESVLGDTFSIITDNNTSLNNLTRFLKDNRTDFSIEESEGVWTLTVTKITGEETHSAAEDYCTTPIPHFERGNFIVVFSSDRMGEGDDELGHLLMNNFIKAIKDLDILPEKLLFYNSGVKLGSVDSPVYAYLKEIESMGVKLLLCATCVNFYSLQNKVKTGTLSNMFEIARDMATAGHIIRP